MHWMERGCRAVGLQRLEQTRWLSSFFFSALLPCCPEKDGVGRCSATTPNTLESGYVLVCRCDGS